MPADSYRSIDEANAIPPAYTRYLGERILDQLAAAA